MDTKIVLIGAGSAMFGLGSLGNILKSRALAGATVALHDTDARALGRVEAVARGYVEQKKLPVKLLATTSRSEALRGAQFCVIAIEVGNRYELWEQDWKIPWGKKTHPKSEARLHRNLGCLRLPC